MGVRRDGAGIAAQGEEPGEHLREGAGQLGEVEREGEDKGLIGKAKTN